MGPIDFDLSKGLKVFALMGLTAGMILGVIVWEIGKFVFRHLAWQ